jgi:hypothetical protein
MDDPIAPAVAALETQDWDALKPLLHPYLHWTDRTGTTIRGRSRALTRLHESHPSGPPAAYELRDGQIYRWTET